jgi:hypothetical protein
LRRGRGRRWHGNAFRAFGNEGVLVLTSRGRRRPTFKLKDRFRYKAHEVWMRMNVKESRWRRVVEVAVRRHWYANT